MHGVPTESEMKREARKDSSDILLKHEYSFHILPLCKGFQYLSSSVRVSEVAILFSDSSDR